MEEHEDLKAWLDALADEIFNEENSSDEEEPWVDDRSYEIWAEIFGDEPDDVLFPDYEEEWDDDKQEWVRIEK